MSDKIPTAKEWEAMSPAEKQGWIDDHKDLVDAEIAKNDATPPPAAMQNPMAAPTTPATAANPMTGVAAGAAQLGGLPFWPATAAAAGTVLAGQSLLSEAQGKPSHNPLGDTQATVSTGGLNQVAKPFIGASNSFKSGKGKDQQQRDAVRQDMIEHGALGNDYSLGLANGAKFDMGADGSIKNYNVDFSNPTAGLDVGYMQPLANIITGGDQKATSDLTGQFVNAARSTGDARANQLQIYKDAGVSQEQAGVKLKQMLDAGKFDQAHYDAYMNGVNQLFGPLANTR